MAECIDTASLTCSIRELCAEKGVVAHVEILTLAMAGKRRALCFVRTDRAAREERLAGAPGLTRFGNDLLFIVDLPPEAPKAKPSAERAADGAQSSVELIKTASLL